jgi:hypothetical protein
MNDASGPSDRDPPTPTRARRRPLLDPPPTLRAVEGRSATTRQLTLRTPLISGWQMREYRRLQ